MLDLITLSGITVRIVASSVLHTLFHLTCAGLSLLLIVSIRLENQGAKLLAQRSLIRWSPNAIAVHRHGEVMYANPATRKMFAT